MSVKITTEIVLGVLIAKGLLGKDEAKEISQRLSIRYDGMPLNEMHIDSSDVADMLSMYIDV